MAHRVTSLGPKPSFLFFLCFFAFLALTLIEEPWFPPKKGHFLLFIFLCFPLSLFSLFLASPFLVFSFFVSLSLYLSLSCSYLSSLLPVSHVAFWFLPFVIGLFAFSFKMLFCVYCSACCLVLFWITIFDMVLLCILFSCCLFCFCCFHIFWFLATKKNSLKKWRFQKQQNWKLLKKAHFDKSS